MWQLAKQADFPCSILLRAGARARSLPCFMKSFDGSECEKSECRRKKENCIQNFIQK